jgi:hypothetical protein
MPERQLTDHELRIVRGMIDEHEDTLRRGRRRSAFWTRTRVNLAFALGLVLVLLQIVVAVITLRGH